MSEENKEQKAPEAASETKESTSAQTGEGDTSATENKAADNSDAQAKAKRAAEARARAAAARAKKAEEAGNEPKPPSPKQPLLDRLVQLIKENVSESAIEEAAINELDGHLPTIVVKSEHWFKCAQFLKDSEELRLNYLRNVSGVDYPTHMEVVYHLQSLDTKQNYCVKVRTNREQPSIPSVTPVWATANWNEREIYDLFGIDFPGHPDLRRIMMPDDWVGHPLRKDYVPYDPEV